tara:strand:- start:800 stop:1051 length:252 start_codon:yes stop_codon:yes gene_type:complete
MTVSRILIPVALVLAGCSETPVEEKGDEAIAEHEQQIQEEAQSLEKAADEAVRALEEDVDAELAADGIGDPADQPAAPEEPEN